MLTKYNKKRKAQVRKYAVQAKAYLAEHPYCEIQAVNDCMYFSDQIEHRAGRLGEQISNVEDFKASCAACSRWVTDHPAAALAMGITKSRLSNLDK